VNKRARLLHQNRSDSRAAQLRPHHSNGSLYASDASLGAQMIDEQKWDSIGGLMPHRMCPRRSKRSLHTGDGSLGA